MKLSYSLTVALLVLSSLPSVYAAERILEVSSGRIVDRETLLARLAEADDVVVGEKHDTASVQNAEAQLFADFARVKKERVTFAWEFWNWSEREKLQSEYAKFRAGEICGERFLRAVFGEANPQLTYLPLMEAVKAADADVLATNLSRKEKAPVTQGGITKLDPTLLPPEFELGGAAYLERFTAEMGGHGTPEQISNYFAAQSLVDDVAALHFVSDRRTPSAFLVIGNFHSRYYDGVWARIVKRAGLRLRTLVEIADPEDETNWETVVHHPKYGNSADFVIFTR